MAIQLNSNQDCCESSCTNTTVNVPGPEGAAGAAGTNGTNGVDGVNAYSTTTAAHTVPAVDSSFNMYVADHAAFSVNQILVISGVGHYLITHKGTDGGGGEYLGAKRLGYPNDTGSTGATIAIGTEVSPAGPQGPAGATGDASTLLTAKGDLLTRTSTGATTIGVGAATDGKTLFANSALNTGLEWKAINFTDVSGTISSAQTAVGSLPLDRLTGPSDQEGDLAYYNGTSWARLPHGSDGQVLTVSGGVPAWSAASSSGLSAAVRASFTVDVSTNPPTISADSEATNIQSVSLVRTTVTSSSVNLEITVIFDQSVDTSLPILIYDTQPAFEYEITSRTSAQLIFRQDATTSSIDRNITLMIFN